MSRKNIELVCFDLGGVLVRIVGGWAEACRVAELPVHALFALFLVLSIGYGTLVSVCAVVAGVWSESTTVSRTRGASLLHYRRGREMAVLLTFALLENLGYRQLTLFWRTQGIWDYLFGKKGWDKFDRKGFEGSRAPSSEVTG